MRQFEEHWRPVEKTPIKIAYQFDGLSHLILISNIKTNAYHKILRTFDFALRYPYIAKKSVTDFS